MENNMPNQTIQIKMLLTGPGIMVSSEVTVTEVSLKQLMDPVNSHPNLLEAAKLGATMLLENYNGLPLGSLALTQGESDEKSLT